MIKSQLLLNVGDYFWFNVCLLSISLFLSIFGAAHDTDSHIEEYLFDKKLKYVKAIFLYENFRSLIF